MFGIGETELVIVVLFAFLLFGPDKLPSLGRTLGRALRQFREAEQGFTNVVRTEFVDPVTSAMNSVDPKVENQTAQVKSDLEKELDADADAPVAPTETFAARKARLMAERKAAAEAAEAAAAAEAEAKAA
ncbi:MAG: twin-arginine translocase TatA/TatE family subunit, partial [Atopobiaceae bacterium]|nr:twin-arginine translocase TatA/TatE family subunit [Atopobiaceae bacterium]